MNTNDGNMSILKSIHLEITPLHLVFYICGANVEDYRTMRIILQSLIRFMKDCSAGLNANAKIKGQET